MIGNLVIKNLLIFDVCNGIDFKIVDLLLVDFGCKEFWIVEYEMFGLMLLWCEYVEV